MARSEFPSEARCRAAASIRLMALVEVSHGLVAVRQPLLDDDVVRFEALHLGKGENGVAELPLLVAHLAQRSQRLGMIEVPPHHHPQLGFRLGELAQLCIDEAQLQPRLIRGVHQLELPPRLRSLLEMPVLRQMRRQTM